MTTTEYHALKTLVTVAEEALEANLNDWYDQKGRELTDAIIFVDRKVKRFEKKNAGVNLT